MHIRVNAHTHTELGSNLKTLLKRSCPMRPLPEGKPKVMAQLPSFELQTIMQLAFHMTQSLSFSALSFRRDHYKLSPLRLTSHRLSSSLRFLQGIQNKCLFLQHTNSRVLFVFICDRSVPSLFLQKERHVSLSLT